MLEMLLGEEIRNAAVVVTRYFGGVLLGTGGLVRAYTRAVQEGLKLCRVAFGRYGLQRDRKDPVSFEKCRNRACFQRVYGQGDAAAGDP